MRNKIETLFFLCLFLQTAYKTGIFVPILSNLFAKFLLSFCLHRF